MSGKAYGMKGPARGSRTTTPDEPSSSESVIHLAINFLTRATPRLLKADEEETGRVIAELEAAMNANDQARRLYWAETKVAQLQQELAEVRGELADAQGRELDRLRSDSEARHAEYMHSACAASPAPSRPSRSKGGKGMPPLAPAGSATS